MPDVTARTPAATRDRVGLLVVLTPLTDANIEDRAPPREVSGMEVVILSVDHLPDERYLAGDPGLISGTGLGEVVDQLLPIVQIAEQVLRPLELANRRGAVATRVVRNLHRVAQLLDGNARRMCAIGKVHTGAVLDSLCCRACALSQRVAQVAAPGAPRADTS